MNSPKASHDLVRGLRALELFARLAPIGVEAYARAGRLALAEARALIEAFESGGYARRLLPGDLYELHPVATKMLPMRNHEYWRGPTFH